MCRIACTNLNIMLYMDEMSREQTPKVLVIDDEQGWRDLFSFELPSKGYEVTTAASGTDAIEKAKKENFDLIITDIKMPGMDGVETFIAIRKIQPEVKVILMTGHAVEDRVQVGLSAKASTCLRKPFELDTLLHTLQTTLSSSS